MDSHLYSKNASRHSHVVMRSLAVMFTLISVATFSGCTTSSITNLTPRNQDRNAESVYPIEVSFDSNLRTIRPESIRPYVQVGNDNYLMRRTPVVPDRWETLIPIPRSQNLINYRVKVDFKYNTIGGPESNSVLSSSYHLVVLD